MTKLSNKTIYITGTLSQKDSVSTMRFCLSFQTRWVFFFFCKSALSFASASSKKSGNHFFKKYDFACKRLKLLPRFLLENSLFFTISPNVIESNLLGLDNLSSVFQKLICRSRSSCILNIFFHIFNFRAIHTSRT